MSVEISKLNNISRYIENTFSHKGLLDYLKEYNVFLAGGALLTLYQKQAFDGLMYVPIRDFDLFFASENVLTEFKHILDAPASGKLNYNYVRQASTENAVTYHCSLNTTSTLPSERPIDVQIIKRRYGSPKEILGGFDLTICQIGYRFKTSEFILGDNFYRDTLLNKLVYNLNADGHPVNTVFRVEKYMKRGYKMHPLELAKILKNIKKRFPAKYKPLENELSHLINTSLNSTDFIINVNAYIDCDFSFGDVDLDY